MKSLEDWSALFGGPAKKKPYLESIIERDKEVGAFLEFDPERMRAGEGELAGIPFAVKDNIMVNEFKCTCGSKILRDFVSPYNATAVQKLIDAGAFVIGKTNLDEFGMGSSTDNSGLAVTNNPWDLSRVPGGSSGGSAAAVAAGFAPFALGSDTGGSIRQPASFCGVYGLKPTYGSVSRYGLVAYASSLEVIGLTASSVSIAEKVYSIMKGRDENDQTSADAPAGIDPGKVSTIGVIDCGDALEPNVKAAYEECAARLEKLGYKIIKLEIPALEYVIPAYYTIATAEASANLARFNGIRYGHRSAKADDHIGLMQKSRDEGFGGEVKLRILLGTYVLRSGFQDQYYHRAQKIRTAIRNNLDGVFSRAQGLLMPVFPTAAFPHGDSGLDQFQQKLADKFTATANLAGIPALAFPADVYDGLPVGMQLMAPQFMENRLFEVCGKMEQAYPPAACPISLDKEAE